MYQNFDEYRATLMGGSKLYDPEKYEVVISDFDNLIEETLNGE